jgi:two-component system, cell cycle sensor histidine kinase and response regulator CckA
MSSKNAQSRPKQTGPSHALKRADGTTAHQPGTNGSGPAGNKPVADNQFEIVFSTNPLAMYICRQDTLDFLEVNAAAVRQYGYSRDEFLRMNIIAIRPQADVPAFLELLRRHGPFSSGVIHLRHQRKNGEVFDVDVTTQNIAFAGQEAALVVVQDTSERRAAEQKLAEHAAFSNALTQNSPLAVVALDLDRHVRACNPAFEELFGYRLEEIVGKELISLIANPAEMDEMLGLVKRVTEGETVRIVGKRRRKDGSLVGVRIIGVPLIVSGKKTGTFGIYEDISERGRAEEAQQRAEEKYRRIFESAVEGFFESTPEGRFVTVNPAMARIAGYSSPAEMVREVYDVGKQHYADPETRKELRRGLEERGILEGFECPMLRKDGSTIWISMNIRAVRDASGKIVSHDGTAEDITDRKRSDLIRQVTTEIIRAVSVTENLDALLRLIHTSLGKVLDAGNCFVALHDLATGKFHFPFFVDRYDEAPHPDKLEDLDRSCTAYVFRTGEAMLISQKRFDQLAAKGEVELVGTACPSWLGVPLRTPAETIGVLVVQNYERENVYTSRDLEFLSSVGGQIALAIERKRSEERARESEARLRVLIEQLPAVLWTVDKNLRFTSAVGSGLARLGLKPNQIVGMSLPDYFETRDQSFTPIAAHLRAVAGDPVTFPVEWKKGSYACHVEPLHDSAGVVQGAICMALDVTDRKQLEEQFRQAQKMEAVGRLAGGIAHDFNNLLMVIQGYADLLADRLPAGESLHRNAVQIQTAAQRAAGLTQQLLAFSRKQILAPKVLNVHGVVADMEKMLQRLIGEDIELETSSKQDLWLVKADRSQIEQVVMNLAVNARDAMPRGGRLMIETANVEFDASVSHSPAVVAPGKYVMLAVTDNGIGMDAKTKAHIFEPFFTTKEKGKGTGLGLATVYGVVKQSGGYVWVYSEPGHGTTFKIYLPRIEDEIAVSGRDRGVETRALPRGSEVVLLVEDEAGVRELAREYLEMSGYTVIVAPDGHTALELAGMHSGPIHLLMTDMVMPGIGGRELAERVLAVRPDIKILYMSGYTDQAVVHQGILGSDAPLLQKPFTLAALTTKLREILAAEVVH